MARPTDDSHAETIKLIKAGKKNREIVEQLGIAIGTVKSRRRAYQQSLKTGTDEKTDLNGFKSKPIKPAPSQPSKIASPPANEVMTPSKATDGNVVLFAKPEKKKSKAKYGADQAQAFSQSEIDNLEARREHLTTLLNLARTLPKPNVTDLRQLIWLEMQTMSEPALKIQGYNAIMRAIALEQKVPQDLSQQEIDAQTMTDVQRERMMIEIMQRGDLSGV